MLKDVVQERGRRLTARIGGRRSPFPTRGNFCYIAQELIRNIRGYFECENASPIHVWINVLNGDLLFTYQAPISHYAKVIYDVAKRFEGDAQKSSPPNGKTIRDELAQALASLADEEREFIFAYYRKNACQEKRQAFRRKERKQRRNNGN